MSIYRLLTANADLTLSALIYTFNTAVYFPEHTSPSQVQTTLASDQLKSTRRSLPAGALCLSDVSYRLKSVVALFAAWLWEPAELFTWLN